MNDFPAVKMFLKTKLKWLRKNVYFLPPPFLAVVSVHFVIWVANHFDTSWWINLVLSIVFQIYGFPYKWFLAEAEKSDYPSITEFLTQTVSNLLNIYNWESGTVYIFCDCKMFPASVARPSGGGTKNVGILWGRRKPL